MYLHVRIQQARVSGSDSEPDRGGFFAQLAHSGYATGNVVRKIPFCYNVQYAHTAAALVYCVT